jgi:hypothetical protein
MNSEKKIVIKCWSCEKKFTISSAANPSITIHRGLAPSPSDPSAKKKRLLKTCPYSSCSYNSLMIGRNEYIY